MKKLVTGWIVVKLCALTLFWLLAFNSITPLVASKASPSPTPTPTPVPTVDNSVERPTSDPYTGDLARFDRENRAENLQIDRVMDLLGIKEGSTVADIGAGGGWFTVIASKRVGKKGKVLAVDISQASIDYIDKRSEREGHKNIETVLGLEGDPKLVKGSVEAVLILNTYHEIAEPVTYLKNLKTSLTKNAKVGIIDRVGSGGNHGVDQDFVKKEAARAGLTFEAEYDFVNKDRMDYFLVFSN